MCGGGLCGTHSASPSWDYSLIFAALRARSSTPDRHLGRLRGARQGGAGYGATPRQFSYAKLRFAGLGRHRRRRRRAERHGYQSLTARQSRDLLLISGRVDCVNTSSPLASPRSTPRGEVINSRGVTRARGSSCGSFLPSLRSVRRSPSAPRKCPRRLALWVDSVSAKDRRRVIPREECVAHAQALREFFYGML